MINLVNRHTFNEVSKEIINNKRKPCLLLGLNADVRNAMLKPNKKDAKAKGVKSGVNPFDSVPDGKSMNFQLMGTER